MGTPSVRTSAASWLSVFACTACSTSDNGKSRFARQVLGKVKGLSVWVEYAYNSMYMCIYRAYGGSGPLACVTLQSRKAAKAPDAAKPQSRLRTSTPQSRKAAKSLTDFDAAKPQSRKAAYGLRRRKAAKPQSLLRTSTLRSLKAAKLQSLEIL